MTVKTKNKQPFALTPGKIIQYAGKVWRVVRYNSHGRDVEGIEVHVVPVASNKNK